MRRDRYCGHPAAETPLHDCTAVRVPKYHSVREKMKVFSLIFVIALAAGVKSKTSSGDTLFLTTRNPKRAAAHWRQARNFEVDSAAPWQRAPPLDHVQVAAVRAAWHES